MEIDQLLFVKFHKIFQVMPSHKSSQNRILKILSGHDGISQKKLQEIMDVKPGSLSEVLLKLEKLGYIVRKPSATDHRCQNVYITDSGLDFFNEVHKLHESESSEFFSVLSDDEKQAMISSLNKLLGPNAQKGKHLEKEKNDRAFEK